MKIATLQLASKLGERDANIQRANELLAEANLSDVDLLVLPEMAFSGYSFPSLEAIEPLLELPSSGPSTIWAKDVARRLNCHVCVGYPERSEIQGGNNFNSLVTVNRAGEVVAHYRKSFLYYTDEVWASEGSGFLFTEVEDFQSSSRVAMGICMDINPYKFQAEWTKYEFASHCIYSSAKLVILSTAWLTSLSPDELETREEPDLDTLNYWLARFRPIIDQRGQDEVIIVFANRCGLEPSKAEGLSRSVDKAGQAVVGFAGTSCVMGIKDGQVRIWDLLGRAEERLLAVDTDRAPKFTLRVKES